MTTLLAEYGTYHRDRRNRAMHEIGIPLIVLAIIALLERVRLGPLDLAAVAIVLVVLFYLRLDVPSALAAFAGYALLYVIGAYVPWWLAIVFFVAGWIFQFAGHVYEGRKPAFLTNLVHLLVGPLWIAALAMRRVS
ncbi:MAG: DUF962 domain-containing protein [Candidatus Eremiobacteraeota bacterium]|nr:DUF962 domain-containing protein [Candidatus Eremiobacteraeota bacterium]